MNKAQDNLKWEKDWWGDCSNTYNEECKQFEYATLMGLDKFKEINQRQKQGFQFNLKGKSILDIGGGPVSLLLKCVNFKSASIIDPCEYPDWVMERYKNHGINYLKDKAENLDDKKYDEVWIYNVLQHTEDPDEILHRAKKVGRIVRIFEWIDTPINAGHPHSLTKSMLDIYFNGKVHKMEMAGCHGTAYVGIFDSGERHAIITIKSQKRFHLLGLAHLSTNKEQAAACAYSQKVLKLGTMLKRSGHKVFFYGVEGSTVDCDEFIQVSTKEVLFETYGDYDYKSEMYKFDIKDLAYRTFDENAIREINKRKQNEDFLLVPFGFGEKNIADKVNLYLTVESGIGYMDTFSQWRIFESYAWMHYIYGKDKTLDGKFYDVVIPNFFDPNDFDYSKEKKDYFLYLGRIIKRKGVQVAIEVVKEINGKLILAGQLGIDKDYIDLKANHLNHVGFVGFDERRKLLSKAKALFAPTSYIGPFEGVTIEAAFSGTPVITTDHGCFAENVIHGKTGYRCRTQEQFIWAANNIHNIKPKDCRDFAMNNFTLDRIREMYDEYFNQLYGLLDKGWYMKNPDRKNLNWLNRQY